MASYSDCLTSKEIVTEIKMLPNRGGSMLLTGKQEKIIISFNEEKF